MEHDGYIHFDLPKPNAHGVGHIVEVVAKSSADCQAKKLTTVEAEAAATCRAVRSVHHNAVGSCPAKSGPGVSDASQVNAHLGHGLPIMAMQAPSALIYRI